MNGRPRKGVEVIKVGGAFSSDHVGAEEEEIGERVGEGKRKRNGGRRVESGGKKNK